MIARIDDIAGVDFVRQARDFSRLENCWPEKARLVLRIVRDILDDEINRLPSSDPKSPRGNFIGMNLFREGRIVNYAEDPEYRIFDNSDTSKHFIEFQTESEAKIFHFILSGILMLGLTPFKFCGEEISPPWALPEMIPETTPEPSFEVHIVPNVPQFDFFRHG